MKKIGILGSTGSIGTQTLDIVRKEKDLEETLANALLQIEEKQYEAELIAEGFAPERIRRYGIVFEGKKCLIG